ncbi:sugar kinase [Sporosarcina sp. YIM B06819]|uniref:sugar kinase n=1 Tax=Sporosarcina sp. YIM B06819 TaxID=3081769 RepID=UPI00298C2B12|nr:sugar kinase [Sporosarcina sp. YIM B06819]
MKKVITFGEIMLRLSTGTGMLLRQANQLSVHYGGAEANVAVSLSHFGYQSYFVSKIPENSLGRAVEQHLKSHGVRTDFLLKGGERLGSYYVEEGAGERSSQVTYDRKYSSFSQLEADEIDIEGILQEVSLIHITGITLALSPALQELVLQIFKKAKEMGVLVSFDFNYRSKLWSQQEAAEAIKLLMPYVDICFCGELDAVHLLGIEPVEESLSQEERLTFYYLEILKSYPNIQYMGSTFRTVQSASSNKLQGNLFTSGKLYQSKVHHLEPIVERIGGGDSYAAGILWGILEGFPAQQIISFATAASALKHTIQGDCSSFTNEEVMQFAKNESGMINR